MPRFNIPSTIKIGNRSVAVRFETDPRVGDNTVYGFYDPQLPEIVIRDAMTPLETVETFWHELMHAIFDYTRFGIELAMELDDKDTPEQDAYKIEERSAESFAKVFLQVIQDNNIAHITN